MPAHPIGGSEATSSLNLHAKMLDTLIPVICIQQRVDGTAIRAVLSGAHFEDALVHMTHAQGVNACDCKPQHEAS